MSLSLDDFFGTTEAARALGVSEVTVRHLADSGLLPCARTRTGHRLFPADAVDSLARHRRRRARRERS